MGESPNLNRANTPEERLASSKLLFDQAKYLLDDEIGHAARLRDARRTISTLLAVILGLGFFKASLVGPVKDSELMVPHWAYIGCAALITLSVIALSYGVWLLFSERSLGYLPAAPVHPLEVGKSSAALAVLDFEKNYRHAVEQASPLIATRACTLALQLAYERLASANRRVRSRIELGRKTIFVGLALALLAFLVYVWTVQTLLPSTAGSVNAHSQPAQAG